MRRRNGSGTEQGSLFSVGIVLYGIGYGRARRAVRKPSRSEAQLRTPGCILCEPWLVYMYGSLKVGRRSSRGSSRCWRDSTGEDWEDTPRHGGTT